MLPVIMFRKRFRIMHSLAYLSSFILLFSGCHHDQPAPLRIQWLTMGTVAAVQCAEHPCALKIRSITQAVFDDVDRELSTWKRDSVLTYVNQAAGTSNMVTISPMFTKVLEYALTAAKESDGAFNPFVGSAMRAWGFNGAPQRHTIPTAAELTALHTISDWRNIVLSKTNNGSAVRLLIPDMQLDLGAIAKGFAVDVAWERLKVAGHTNVLIDLGGNLRALGEAAPGRHGWQTGVRNPFDKNTLLGRFLLRDGEAVATSGNYERFVEIQGVRYAHILDPTTLTPVTGMASVTVVAPNATIADALSTALFVLGPEKGTALLRRHPDYHVLWIPDTPNAITIIATPAMAARLTPIKPTQYTLTIINP